MKKIIICSTTLVLAVAVLLGCRSLYAQDRPVNQLRSALTHEDKAGFVHLLLDLTDLNITADQKAGMKAVFKKYWGEAKPVLKELNASRIELREVIRATPFDEQQIREAVYKRATAEADLAVIRGKLSAEVRTLLTPDQKQKIHAIMDKVDQRIQSVPKRVEERMNQE